MAIARCTIKSGRNKGTIALFINEDGAKELVRVMQEVDFASLTAREAAPDPTSSECGADMELYMHLCRRVLALGIKRWGGDAPGRLGPRVLDPDEPRDRAMIEGMFAPQPEADGEADAGLQTPAQGALPLAPQSLTTGSATGAPQPMEVGATTWSDLAPFRVCNGLDIFVVPNFAQTQLSIDPANLQQELETNYPTRGADDAIQPNVVQWVGGDNKALRYRGNAIPRTKIWLQRLPKEDGYLRYGYTGWQWNVLPATVGVEQCPEVLPLADRYDEWAAARGLPSANHYIATRYSDGKDCIGWHSLSFQRTKPRRLNPATRPQGPDGSTDLESRSTTSFLGRA